MQAADLLLLCCWVGTAKTVVESFLGFNLLQSLIEIVCFLFPSCLGNPSEKRHFKSTLKCSKVFQKSCYPLHFLDFAIF